MNQEDLRYLLLFSSFLMFIFGINLQFTEGATLRRLGKLWIISFFLFSGVCAMILMSGCSTVKKDRQRHRRSEKVETCARVLSEMESRSRQIIQEEIDTTIILPAAQQTLKLGLSPSYGALFPGLITAVFQLDSLGLELKVQVDTLNRTMTASAKQAGRKIPVKKRRTITTDKQESGRKDSTGREKKDLRDAGNHLQLEKKPDRSWIPALLITIAGVAAALFIYSWIRKKIRSRGVL